MCIINIKNMLNDPYINQMRYTCKKFNTKAYLVGGAVRDTLLNIKTHDYDFVIFNNTEKISKDIASKFTCKMIKHKKKIETYRIFCGTKTIDISTPRGKTIEEDLTQRDFTINSIAIDIFNGKIIDPLKGKKDIIKHLIRANSASSIENDPVRILRGFRLAATFRFDIEANTIEIFKNKVKLIKKTSVERIAKELLFLFMLNETFTYIMIMDKVGVLDTLFEDLSLTNACIQSSSHLYDVKTHSLNVYNYIEWSTNRLQKIMGRSFTKYLLHYTKSRETILPALKLAAIFHDSGKPFTKIVVDNKIKFPFHEKKSAIIFEKYANRYPFGKKISTLTKFFIENHIKPSNLFKKWNTNELEDIEIIDFFLKYKENAIDLLIFALADTLAKGKISASKKEIYTMFLQEMSNYYYSNIETRLKEKPLLAAKDILKLYPDLEKNKLNPLLTEIKKLQLANIISSKEDALSIIKKII